MEWSGAVSLGAMTQRITRDEVVHVARLARLTLSDAEIDEFTSQLGDILEHAADIESLTPAAIAAFLASDAATGSARGGSKKASSANAMRTSIRCFSRWAHEAGLVAANPARLLRRARCAPPPPKGLHADEQARLLEVLTEAKGQAAERDRVLITLLLYSGIRIGSAIALDIEDIDLVHGVNSHHIAEAAFKAVAKSLRMAVESDPRMAGSLPSTKGAL